MHSNTAARRLATALSLAALSACAAETAEPPALQDARYSVYESDPAFERALSCVASYAEADRCTPFRWWSMYWQCGVYREPSLRDGFLRDRISAGACTSALWPGLEAVLRFRHTPPTSFDESLACVSSYASAAACDPDNFADLVDTCRTFEYEALSDGVLAGEVDAGACTADNWPALEELLRGDGSGDDDATDRLPDVPAVGALSIQSGSAIGRCLTVDAPNDAPTDTSTANVVTSDCARLDAQRLSYDRASKTLRTVSGACLDATGDSLASAACSGEPTQRFALDSANRLRVAGTTRCVAAPSTGSVRVAACGRGRNQVWAVQPLHDEIDLDALTVGVSATAAPLDLAPMGAIAGTAMPLLATEDGTAIAVAGTFGRARAVGFGSWLSLGDLAREPGLGTLVRNAVRWAAGRADSDGDDGDGGDATPTAGLAPGAAFNSRTVELLESAGMQVRRVDFDELADIDLLVLGSGDSPSDGYRAEDLAALEQYVARGGGLVAARWTFPSWESSHHPISENLSARILSHFGFGWTQASYNIVPRDTRLVVPTDRIRAGNTTAAFEAAVRDSLGLESLTPAERSAISDVTRLSMSAHVTLPVTAPFVAAQGALKAIVGPLRFDMDSPFEFDRGLLSDLAMRGDYLLYSAVDAEDLPVHEVTASFPGLVSDDAERIVRTLTVDATVPQQQHERWASTGLYAAPGEAIAVTVPDSAVGTGLRVRIGASFDNAMPGAGWISKRPIGRFPKVYAGRLVSSRELRFANPFGGLVYVVLPSGIALGDIEITIAGAVAAPRFVLGQTDPAAFAEALADRSVPAGEIEGASMILTARSRFLRDGSDPAEIATFYDQIVEAEADLVGATREDARGVEAMPQRIVFDPWEKWGAHAGYPIHMTEDWTASVVDLDIDSLLSGSGLWGVLHEVGHNYQQAMWTIDSFWEVTTNVLAVYAFEAVLGLPKDQAWNGNLEPGKRRRQLDQYLRSSRPYDEMGYAVGLESLLLIVEGFGWQAMQDVFAEYRALPDWQRPATEQARIDQWVIRTSTRVQRNLVPYFEALRFPVSADAKAQVEDLPAWDENPLAGRLVSIPAPAPAFASANAAKTPKASDSRRIHDDHELRWCRDLGR